MQLSQQLKQDSSFNKKFGKKECRNIIRAVETVEFFLPKDPSSPWPKELRRQDSRHGGIVLFEWDGTVGATVTLGPVVEPFLKNCRNCRKRTAGMNYAQAAIRDAASRFEILTDAPSLDVAVMKQKFGRYATRIHEGIRIGDDTYTVLTQDMLKLIATASRYRMRSIRFAGLTCLRFINKDYALISFCLTPGVMIYILSNPQTD